MWMGVLLLLLLLGKGKGGKDRGLVDGMGGGLVWFSGNWT